MEDIITNRENLLREGDRFEEMSEEEIEGRELELFDESNRIEEIMKYKDRIMEITTFLELNKCYSKVKKLKDGKVAYYCLGRGEYLVGNDYGENIYVERYYRVKAIYPLDEVVEGYRGKSMKDFEELKEKNGGLVDIYHSYEVKNKFDDILEDGGKYNWLGIEKEIKEFIEEKKKGAESIRLSENRNERAKQEERKEWELLEEKYKEGRELIIVKKDRNWSLVVGENRVSRTDGKYKVEVTLKKKWRECFSLNQIENMFYLNREGFMEYLAIKKLDFDIKNTGEGKVVSSKIEWKEDKLYINNIRIPKNSESKFIELSQKVDSEGLNIIKQTSQTCYDILQNRGIVLDKIGEIPIEVKMLNKDSFDVTLLGQTGNIDYKTLMNNLTDGRNVERYYSNGQLVRLIKNLNFDRNAIYDRLRRLMSLNKLERGYGN